MDRRDLQQMFSYAMEAQGPVAIRYPRGTALDGIRHALPEINKGEAEILRLGKGTALLAVGSMVKVALDAADLLLAEGESITVVNMRFVKPFDTGLIDQLVRSHDCMITLEDNVLTGGFGSQVADYICRKGHPVHVEHVAVPDSFIPHGSVDKLREIFGMDAFSVAERVKAYRDRQENR
jgi:1-deoxy-D-xylulose-5-phosphate synthase